MHALRRGLTVAALMGSFVWTSAATAQVARVGGEFQVSSYTLGAQLFPSVGADADGDFVAAWESNAQDGSSYGIFAQRYDSGGNRLGSEFQVNTYTPGGQINPHIAADPDGDFAIAWVSYRDGSSGGIFGQRYSSGGTAAGTEFQVNTYTPGLQNRPSAAAAPDGTFVVVWQSYRDGSYAGVFGQRFDSSGIPAGSEFQVNTYTLNRQRNPNVASDADGNLVVVWESVTQDGSGRGAFGQRFDTSGSRVGTEFQVDAYTAGYQSYPQVAADADGDFTVVWDDGGYPSYRDGSGVAIVGRRFTSAGSASGPPFVVNAFTDSNQILPAVAGNADGDFVVTWSSYAQDGSSWGQFARRFSSAGSPLTTEFQVNSFTPSYQLNYFAQPIADTPQGFVVVWWSGFNHDGFNVGVFGQRFAVASPATATPTATPTATDTETPTATPTETATSTHTPTVTPTLQAGCPAVPSDLCFAARKEKVLIKGSPATFKWKWSNGLAPFGPTDFGDPLNGTTSYKICVYDQSSGSPVLKMGATVGPGGTCGTLPCWKTVGSNAGWKYKNKDGNADGITQLLIKGGGPTQSKLQVKGRGASLPVPAPFSGTEFFDQDTAVTVQLYSSFPVSCWSSTFGTSTTKKNDETQFKAKQLGAVPATPVPRRVFVTSATYTGNLGGLSGADAICQAHASSASLSGSYKAWLADDSTSPANRFLHSTNSYVLVDGTVVADNWADLTDSSIQHAIDKTESNGAPPATDTVCAPTDRLVWTNVFPSGGLFMAADDCTDWTNGTSSIDSAAWGDSSHSDNIWTGGCNGSGIGLCSKHASLYCFEQ